MILSKAELLLIRGLRGVSQWNQWVYYTRVSQIVLKRMRESIWVDSRWRAWDHYCCTVVKIDQFWVHGENPSLKHKLAIYVKGGNRVSIAGLITLADSPSPEALILAATKQLYEWFSPSVRLSVRPSVCLSVCPSATPFWLCSHHRIIMKFSGVITSDKSDVHANSQGQRSKVKVTQVTTQLNRFRTVTPV